MKPNKSIMTDKTLEQNIDEIFDNFELDIIAYQNYGDSVNIIQKLKEEKTQQLISLIKDIDRQARLETKIYFANDMFEMNKWNEQARNDELYKIIRQSKDRLSSIKGEK